MPILMSLLGGALCGTAPAQDASRVENSINYLERLITNHRDGVRAVAALPDGKRFVSASNDHTAKLWELSTGKLLHTFQGHTGAVRCVAVSSDGSRIATGSEDSSVIVWDVATGKIVSHLTGHAHTVIGVAFLPDGRLSSIGGEGLRVWDLDTEKTVVRGVSDVGGFPFRAAYSADGTRAAILDSFGPSTLWDTRTCKVVETTPGGNFDHLLAIGQSPDGNTVIYPDEKGYTIFDVRQKVPTLIKQAFASVSIAFSPDGKRVVVSAGSFAIVWTLNPPKLETTLGMSQITMVHGVAFAADGHHVLAGIGGHEAPVWTADPPNGVAIFDLDRKKNAIISGPGAGEISWELIPAHVESAAGKLISMQEFFQGNKWMPMYLRQDGKDSDVVWTEKEVFVHRKPGVLTPIYDPGDASIVEVTPDGQYLWINCGENGMFVIDRKGTLIATADRTSGLPGGWKENATVALGAGKLLVSATGSIAPQGPQTGWIMALEVVRGSKALKVIPIVDESKHLLPEGWTATTPNPEPTLKPLRVFPYRDSEIWVVCYENSQAPLPIVRIDRQTLKARVYNVGRNGKPFPKFQMIDFVPGLAFDDGQILGLGKSFAVLPVGPSSVYDAPETVLCADPRQQVNFFAVRVGDHYDLPGKQWVRLDPAASKSGRILGPGLQAGGHPIERNIAYGVSAHFGLCAVSLLDNGFYKISDDAKNPLAIRPVDAEVEAVIVTACLPGARAWRLCRDRVRRVPCWERRCGQTRRR